MPNLLLELYSEEIPAKLQLPAINQLKNAFEAFLKEEKLEYSEIKGFITPCRMIITIKDLPSFTKEETIEKKGPQISANAEAINGFLKSVNLSDKSDLNIQNIDGKDFYFAKTIHQKVSSAAIFEKIIPKILHNFSWPKSMKWGNYEIRWIRPLHNILCLFDNNILNFKFGHLASNNISFGHKFMNKDGFEVKDIESFIKLLIEKNVIYDHLIRKKMIHDECATIAKQNNIELIEDEDLLDEVTGLVEFPNALLGKIDQKYMNLPEEVLITSIKTNQRYFCFKNGAKLANYFVTIANVKTDNDELIINGNQKVLSARLEDALFFWNHDLKTKLETQSQKLKKVTFHQKLGSVFDKIERMEKIGFFLSNYIKVDKKTFSQALLLAKADLVTEMVGEFPNLQGIIGKYYAIHQGYLKEVCNAIEEHYKPLGANDEVPTATLSIILALADKFDTLVGMWLIGEKPTSSKDPYALRRSALGIIRILIENKIDANFPEIINKMIEIYREKYSELDEKLALEIIEFIKNRFIVYVKTSDIKHDIVNAVIDDFDSVYQVYLKIIELNNFLNTQRGASLVKSYLRAVKIVNAEQKKDSKIFDENVNISLFEFEEERIIFEKVEIISKDMNQMLAKYDYLEALGLIQTLKEPIDSFFEKVIVNSENYLVRENRLKLLTKIKNLLDKFASFEKLEI